MGTYLSTPITEKCEEEGAFLECTDTPVAWGVVDMQGWRKSMEDAHIATANKDFKVFGVFDGHGGPEVARLCQLYLVSALTQQPTWAQALKNEKFEGHPAKSPIGVALREGFHSLDRIIADPNRR
jgi:serine/threonine protein phosphatase PrpC